MDPVIEFENVSKRYLIGTGGRSLRSALTELPRRLMGRSVHDPAELWALRDVSFQVEPGESLGILGHNGAGKTTVLKLLSGITKPTHGNIQVRGRLGTLIELGAGFHPEMTGRENVFLNGVILGMGRKEVARRFNSIVDFSGVGRFIDTPVKRYSSGMYVRLAFAVAAHVDPAVLLVDEVLAVGDVAFRAKCYRRMAELRRNGTTIVLVSHSIYAIRDTCDRALLLWQGQLLEDGQPDSVISSYLARMQSDGIESGLHLSGELERSAYAEAIESTGTTAKIVEVVFRGNAGQPVEAVESGSPVTIEVRYSSLSSVERPIFRIDFYREGNLYTGFSTAYDDEPLAPLMGDGEVSLHIRNTYLPPGVYSISVVIAVAYEFNLLDTHHQAYFLQVLRSPNSRGDVPLPHTWQHRLLDTSEEEGI